MVQFRSQSTCGSSISSSIRAMIVQACHSACVVIDLSSARQTGYVDKIAIVTGHTCHRCPTAQLQLDAIVSGGRCWRYAHGRPNQWGDTNKPTCLLPFFDLVTAGGDARGPSMNVAQARCEPDCPNPRFENTSVSRPTKKMRSLEPLSFGTTIDIFFKMYFSKCITTFSRIPQCAAGLCDQCQDFMKQFRNSSLNLGIHCTTARGGRPTNEHSHTRQCHAACISAGCAEALSVALWVLALPCGLHSDA